MQSCRQQTLSSAAESPTLAPSPLLGAIQGCESGLSIKLHSLLLGVSRLLVRFGFDSQILEGATFSDIGTLPMVLALTRGAEFV